MIRDILFFRRARLVRDVVGSQMASSESLTGQISTIWITLCQRIS